MIEVYSIKHRRSRWVEGTPLLHDHSFSYCIKVARDNITVRIPVCINALLSTFGIGKAKLESIRKSLAKAGEYMRIYKILFTN